MTPAGIEPATFRFVAQHLNHCATAVPNDPQISINISEEVAVHWHRCRDGTEGLGSTEVYKRSAKKALNNFSPDHETIRAT